MTTPAAHRQEGVLPLCSVVIPAHDEERGIGRLLSALTEGVGRGRLDIVVVANGCTDRTADVARRHPAGARVEELAEPSKAAAMRHADELTAVFPRAYVDADVVITGGDLQRLVEAIARPGVHAAAPARRVERTGMSRATAWYYDVWESLPAVRDGLFGRGVVLLSREGHARLRALPSMMSDDLVASEAFRPDERVVVEAASVLIRPPRTLRDLVRRRIRVSMGNRQADTAGLRTESARTTVASLVRLSRARPALAARVPLFLAVALVARVAAWRRTRRGDYSVWLRDESSRQ